jgi:hypothetical protein
VTASRARACLLSVLFYPIQIDGIWLTSSARWHRPSDLFDHEQELFGLQILPRYSASLWMLDQYFAADPVYGFGANL